MLIGYGRVSTQDQHIDLQTSALKNAGCENIFIEQASGSLKERPQLKEALNYARQGDTLIVWKLDRLGRSLPHLIDTIQMLKEKGIAFKSLTETIDTSTSGGTFIFHIFGALAEFERALIRERTYAGLAQARLQGKVGGRPKKWTDKNKVVVDALLKDKSLTISEIAKQIGVSQATLYRHMPSARTL